MTPREAVLLIYGFIFGTSTPYLKPKNRYLFPTAIYRFDPQLTFFLGGSGICAEFRDGDRTIVINLNQGEASQLWVAELQRRGGIKSADVVLNSLSGVFGTHQILKDLSKARALYVHTEIEDQPFGLNDLAFEAIVKVDAETKLVIGDETIHLIPVSGCATTSDLIVFFEKRSVMMFGSLFSNRIHPELFHGAALRAQKWIATLEHLLQRFSPQICVPGEGEFGSADEVREFVRYLKCLTDPAVEFSFCRKNFDWIEIPSATSLEENFDILRRNVKTHTSLN